MLPEPLDEHLVVKSQHEYLVVGFIVLKVGDMVGFLFEVYGDGFVFPGPQVNFEDLGLRPLPEGHISRRAQFQHLSEDSVRSLISITLQNYGGLGKSIYTRGVI